MSELNRIADLLRQAIKSRQVLAVGAAQFAAVEGNTALFTTPSGTISAVATNFCYGNCLLAKVEGTWYAHNPADNREVIRSSVDRMIQTTAKSTVRNGRSWISMVDDVYFIPINPDTSYPVATSLITPQGSTGGISAFLWVPLTGNYDLSLKISGNLTYATRGDGQLSSLFTRYGIQQLFLYNNSYELISPNTVRFFGKNLDVNFVNYSDITTRTGVRADAENFAVSPDDLVKRIGVDGNFYMGIYFGTANGNFTGADIPIRLTIVDNGEFDLGNTSVDWILKSRI